MVLYLDVGARIVKHFLNIDLWLNIDKRHATTVYLDPLYIYLHQTCFNQTIIKDLIILWIVDTVLPRLLTVSIYNKYSWARFFIKKLSVHGKNQNVINGRLEAKRSITNDGQFWWMAASLFVCVGSPPPPPPPYT